MGGLDRGFIFIMHGIVFGFWVIDDDFVRMYECRFVKKWKVGRPILLKKNC